MAHTMCTSAARRDQSKVNRRDQPAYGYNWSADRETATFFSKPTTVADRPATAATISAKRSRRTVESANCQIRIIRCEDNLTEDRLWRLPVATSLNSEIIYIVIASYWLLLMSYDTTQRPNTNIMGTNYKHNRLLAVTVLSICSS